jgi:hypothetical protein
MEFLLGFGSIYSKYCVTLYCRKLFSDLDGLHLLQLAIVGPGYGWLNVLFFTTKGTKYITKVHIVLFITDL